ncbi:hypothetical protein HPO96_22235 [Kribbella sandramycini]|uniref:Uncharacterized protein n=1 Tax=Kribbella sandramycini TaxID=60450 RepID=A0A7Y4L265_9ACTN|nr:hypothetical protein [Kribbella sandramycini]MBB6566369.1 hypothetical protein [Kribbella sandramycini]NOL42970.1 hypothetical protein [Kribbella sandramycini]
MNRSRHRIRAGLLALALLTTIPLPAEAAEPVPADRTINLVTGDTVRVSADRKTVVPEAGPGRKVTFSIHRSGDRVSVIPSDALARIGRGQLDPELFTVTPGGRKAGRLPTSGETVELTINHRDRNGSATGDYLDLLIDRDSGAFYLLPTEPDGVTKVLAPKGRYLLDSTIAGGTAGLGTSALVLPRLDLTGDRTVNLDARQARAVDVGLTDPDADQVMANVFFGLTRPGSSWVSGISESPDSEPVFTAQVGQSVPELTSEASAQFARQNADGSFDETPFVYALSESRPGKYYTGFRKIFTRAEVAKLTPTFVGAAGGTAAVLPLSFVPGIGGGRGRVYRYSGLPAAPVFYVSGGTPWMFDVWVADGPDASPVGLRDHPTTYKAGQTYTQRWGRAVLSSSALNVSRTGNNLQLILPYTDADGHYGFGEGTLTVIRDDQKLDVLPYPFKDWEAYPVPAGPGKYKLELVTPTITSTWSFESTTTAGTTALPLAGIRFQPGVDNNNVLRTGATHQLPLTVESPTGTAGTPRVETSTDGGTTWRVAPIRAGGDHRYLATVAVPEGAGAVALRAQVIDAAGNKFETTVTDAYRVAR